MSETSEKFHFVMVHGFSHGAWCWYKIRSLLEASDHKVSCIDLKGSGIDPSDPNTIFTFQDYNKPLINLLSNLPQNQKVILVGHSSGGQSLTYAIHKFANKIRMAIYVGATMLKHGMQGDPDLSMYGDVCKKIYGLGADQPATSMMIKEEFQRKILYHLSSKEDSTLAVMLMRPGPLRPLVGLRFTEGVKAESVPRVYIKTLQDRVLKREQQEAMVKRWPPSLVFALESDHCPFFSTPTLLFAFLLKAAASVNAAT
ncbi:Methylesterase 17 [Hibiscus syriacus]|uniref:Methylesterase 17 n=1 Tax=Hibiscus syriacus TaxID=106335 RepID=A0A6A2WZR5_HIBSY|nr:Methylesterase 17 [Hibiscus syriacus]